MSATLEELVRDSVGILRRRLAALGLQEGEDLEQLAELIDLPEEHPDVVGDPEAVRQVGYLQGVADAHDCTVLEVLTEYLGASAEKGGETR